MKKTERQKSCATVPLKYRYGMGIFIYEILMLDIPFKKMFCT
jgi:hypothetical protein